MSNPTKYDLDQYKTDAQKQIEEKRRNSQQAADINYQKLQKYLPQQTKGYSIGMTETAKIAANNAYQRQLAQAESDYNADMTELNNYVRTEQERLDDKEKAEQERLEDKAKAEQDKLFNEAKGIIEGGAWNTGSELQNYISGLEGKLSDNQYGVLKQYAGSIANNREQKAAEIEQSKAYNEDGTTRIEAKTSAKATLDGYLNKIKAGNDFKVGGYKHWDFGFLLHTCNGIYALLCRHNTIHKTAGANFTSNVIAIFFAVIV